MPYIDIYIYILYYIITSFDLVFQNKLHYFLLLCFSFFISCLPQNSKPATNPTGFNLEVAAMVADADAKAVAKPEEKSVKAPAKKPRLDSR